MQKNISFLELACLLKELQIIIDAKVDKIYVNPDMELLLQLHLPNKGKKILRISPPHFMYLSEYRADTQEKPSGFTMFLRKQSDNSRIKSIFQIDSERIAAITFQTKEELFTLYIELFSKGNLIFCNQKNEIIAAYDQQAWKDRTIKVGLPYNFPKKQYNFFKFTKSQLSEIIKSSDKESIVKILALDLGLGGLYSEELCLNSNISKNKKHLTEEEIAALFKEIKHFQSLPLHPSIVEDKNELVPFDLQCFKDNPKKYYPSFNELLDTELTNLLVKQKQFDLTKKANKKADELKKIISQQQEHMSEIQKLIDENQEKAEHIYNKYQLVDNILKEIRKAREKHSWKEFFDILFFLIQII